MLFRSSYQFFTVMSIPIKGGNVRPLTYFRKLLKPLTILSNQRLAHLRRILSASSVPANLINVR